MTRVGMANYSECVPVPAESVLTTEQNRKKETSEFSQLGSAVCG